jgi:F-type H+-transporting ATPase subunit gamma
MSGVRAIKRRIKSAKNISQVTKALEMVSAVKMRRAQATAIAGKPYAIQLHSVLSYLAGRVENDLHPFLTVPAQISKVLVVVIGPEKGLAGSLVTNLTRRVFRIKDQLDSGIFTPDDSPGSISLSSPVSVSAVAWGRKAKDVIRKTGWPLSAYFTHRDKKTLEDMIRALSKLVMDAYLQRTADLVLIAFPEFISTVTQKPSVVQFLPMVSASLVNEDQASGSSRLESIVSFEPSPSVVLESLLTHYQATVLSQIIFDSTAAEHSARMVAMKNASDNAFDIIKYLTLKYNQTRQSSITNEIADIVSGSLISA